MVWCGDCYQKGLSDKFHINTPLDEDGELMYDDQSDQDRFCKGLDGAHLICPFQCELCMFRTLFKRNPNPTRGDLENLVVLRRMNLDLIWAREPSTIHKNMLYLNNIITICEAGGMVPNLACPGPFPFEDIYGWSIAYAMLVKSLNPGRHSKTHTQYATIRKLRSAAGNLYNASRFAAEEGALVTGTAIQNVHLTNSPTNSMWFTFWTRGCQARMGHILKQDKAIAIKVLLQLIKSFVKEIKLQAADREENLRLVSGLAYSVISYGASLRGSEGLKLDLKTLIKHFDKGSKLTDAVPHVVVPLRGRFKGEQGERCHLLPLSNVTKSGIQIRETLRLLIHTRNSLGLANPWAFVNMDGSKMSFGAMNDIILDRLESVKEEDVLNTLDLKDVDIREEFSINRSFRRGSSTHAQNMKVPEPSINLQNRWRKTELAKGRKQNFSMVENYGDIQQLVPALVVYSSML